jgi:hypothetical protein
MKPIYNFDPDRKTNGQAIVELATLGYLDGEILDLTVGPEAGFWTRYQPDVLVTNDLDPEVTADFHFDVRVCPLDAKSFDAVTWDPPYGYRGTSRLASDARYGLARSYQTPDEIDSLLFKGTDVALGLARRYVFVKCQNQNVSGAYRPQADRLKAYAEGQGATVVGEMYVTSARAQPAGKRQCNIWVSVSSLVVLAL